MSTNKGDGFLSKTFKVLRKHKRTEAVTLDGRDVAELQVALMVAALDGRIAPEEFKTFDRQVRKCEGVTPETAAAALETALRSGGYLLAQSFRLKGKAFATLFVEEVGKLIDIRKAVEDVRALRRAYCMWMSMAMADDDFSADERACLLALHATIREAVTARAQAEMQEARQHSPIYVSEREIREGTAMKVEAMWPVDFPEWTEALLKRLKGEDDPETLRGIRALIDGGDFGQEK